MISPVRRPRLLLSVLIVTLTAASCGTGARTVTSVMQRDEPTLEGLTALGPGATPPVATVGSVAADSNPLFGVAEACSTEKAILLNAVEAYRQANDAYPQPAGRNGWGPLVGDFISAPSEYWAYTLPDSTPSLQPLGRCR